MPRYSTRFLWSLGPRNIQGLFQPVLNPSHLWAATWQLRASPTRHSWFWTGNEGNLLQGKLRGVFGEQNAITRAGGVPGEDGTRLTVAKASWGSLPQKRGFQQKTEWEYNYDHLNHCKVITIMLITMLFFQKDSLAFAFQGGEWIPVG